MRVREVVLSALVASSSLAMAQSPQTPTFRAGVELLEVDVTVVDDQGKPVGDLHAPEFAVSVEGEPRKVVSADFVSFNAPTDPARAPVPQETYFSSNAGRQTGRLIVMAVDQGNIRAGEGRTVMAAAGRFLDRLTPADRVALVTVPPPGPTVDFTANRELIRTGLSRMVGSSDRIRGKFNIGLYEALAVDQHSDLFAVNELMVRLCGESPTAVAEVRCELDVETEAKMLAQDMRMQTDASIRALRSLLESLRDVEGPKSLVLVSQGLILEGTGSEASDLAAIAASSRVSINVLMLDAQAADPSIAELPPTARADRELQVHGLEMLAARSRGTLFRVFGNADYTFERLNRELSAYYLLGVEPAPRDRDGKRHQIRVDVRRRGTTVRARREFQFGGTPSVKAKEDGENLIARVLRSPLVATELPVRLATYAYQDAATSKVKVVVATEIDRAGTDAAELSIGFVLFDPEGRVVTGGHERKTLKPADRRPLEYNLAFLVDPGTYTLKFAVIDEAGRRGSVEHQLSAWQMSGQPLAVGDLMLADAPAASTGAIRPTVDLRLDSGRLAAYMELYTDRAEALQDVKVVIEVAADESSPALTTGPATLQPRGDGRRRDASAILPVGMLPPGRYVARAVVSASGRTVGKLTRPFQVLPGSVAARASAPTAAPAGADTSASVVSQLVTTSVARFQREEVLKPEVLQSVFEAMDKTRPAAKAAVARARTGRLEGTGLRALQAGDQVAAAFLRGLELFIKGQLDPAATQFGVSLRLAPDFAPAAFYLGACYAAVGRDQEAAGNWEKALTGQWQVPLASRVLGQAWLRLGQTARAIEPLRVALGTWPDNDEIRRNLAIAYFMTGQHHEAYATVEPYLLRHPSDHEALLLAIQAIYEAHAAGRSVNTPEQDREQVTRYARAYAAANGPHQPLVTRWVDFITQDKR